MAERVFSYVFTGNFSGLQSGLTAASRNVSDLGSQMTALDKNGAQMRAGLTQLGNTAGKVGLVAAAGVGVAIAANMKFEQSVSAMAAATGAAGDELNSLRDAAMQAGQDTVFSATEAADAVTELAKAGVSTSDILGGALSGSLDLAAAGGIGVAEAAGIAATTLQQFKLSGEDATHVADLLAAGAGKAMGDVGDLSQALNQSGLVASQMGLSVEETTGALAAFASAGLLGSDAGTSFKSMLAALTPNSAKAAETMQQLGLNAFDAQGNFVGLASYAGQLQTALGDMSAEQRQAALETIFGSDAVRAASVLYEQGADGITAWTGRVDDAGYAAEQAAALTDNLAGDLEALKGSLETALIGAGEGANGPLRELVQGVTDAINAFNDLPGPVKTTVTALGGLTAVTGGGLWFGSKVVNGIADTKQALADLGWSADRSSTSLSKVGTALKVTGLIAGLALVGEAVDRLGTQLETADLARNLEAFARGADVANFDDLGFHIETLASSMRGFEEPLLELTSGFGLLGDTARDKASREIGLIDDALAGLVESGNADMAADAFERLMEAATSRGVDAAEARSQFDAYGTALENAAAGSDELTNALGESVPVLDAQTGAIERNRKSLLDRTSAALGAFDAETRWRQALMDAAEQAKKNQAGIQGNTEAAQNNRAALSELASAWNNQSKAVRQNEERQQAARDAFIRAAEGMGVSSGAAKDLADKLLAIPEKREPKVTVKTNANEAMRAIQGVWDWLNILDGKTATTYVTTRRVGQSPGFGPVATSASGSTVPRNRPAPVPMALIGA